MYWKVLLYDNYSMTKKTIINQNAIIAINISNRGSSGVIMNAALSGANSIESTDVYKILPQGENNNNVYCFANSKSRIIQLLKEIFYKLNNYRPIDGTYFNFYTRKVIRKIKEIASSHQKTIIHIHNIHHSQLNIFKLLSFLVKKQFNTIITLHDAWFYTGGCYCYDHNNCTEWRNGCNKCRFNFKKTNRLQRKKTNLINNNKNIYLVTVSKWLKQELLLSSLKSKPIRVIYGCTDIKKPITTKRYNFGKEANGKKILLSVSDYWNEWKGIDYLKGLSFLIPSDCILVLVGGEIDLSCFRNTIHIKQVSDRNVLAEIYSSSDVYVSTSQTETLGLSACEAQICGCPVVTFGCGGSKETVINNKSGFIVENKNLSQMLSKIKTIIESKCFAKDDIFKNGNRFLSDHSTIQYKLLYESIIFNKHN